MAFGIGNIGRMMGSNFLRYGKYFLILIILSVQGLIAYQIIDSYYEDIYTFIEGYMPDPYGTYNMGELIVNPSETNGQRYLLVEISFKLQHKKHVELVKAQELKIKHNMNEALSSRTVEELVSYDTREILRKELAEIVNKAIGIRSVRNLYYNKYVLQ